MVFLVAAIDWVIFIGELLSLDLSPFQVSYLTISISIVDTPSEVTTIFAQASIQFINRMGSRRLLIGTIGMCVCKFVIAIIGQLMR